MSDSNQGEPIDEMIAELQKTHKNLMQIISNYSSEHKNKVKKFDDVLNSNLATQENKMEAAILKRLEMVEMANGITHTYNILNILNVTLLVKSVSISVENIEKQLTESGVIEKVKAVENTKKELLNLIKQLKEDIKRIEKSRENANENLNYIS
jgi:gas vesicle protein